VEFSDYIDSGSIQDPIINYYIDDGSDDMMYS
jgi:hypothetical protein